MTVAGMQFTLALPIGAMTVTDAQVTKFRCEKQPSGFPIKRP